MSPATHPPATSPRRLTRSMPADRPLSDPSLIVVSSSQVTPQLASTDANTHAGVSPHRPTRSAHAGRTAGHDVPNSSHAQASIGMGVSSELPGQAVAAPSQGTIPQRVTRSKQGQGTVSTDQPYKAIGVTPAVPLGPHNDTLPKPECLAFRSWSQSVADAVHKGFAHIIKCSRCCLCCRRC